MAAPIILCDCAGMDEKRWLECREHGPKGDIEYTVGGSDVATIFGLSPWTTPLELWMTKKGRMKTKAKPNFLQLEMGHLLEPIAAHFYAQRTGDTVIDDTNMYQHADFPYALADIDRRLIQKASGEPGILECKSCTYHKAADWADGAYPLYYEFQLRYYLAVMDVNFGAFAALWGNNPDNDLATPSLLRDKAKEDMIFERLDEWIWSLRKDKPPAMTDVAPKLALDVNANLKMSIFAEIECHFSAVSVEVYTALIHNFTCRLEARQALIYQLVLGLTGENGKYNYSRAVHLYPPFSDITCSAENYKIAPALTLEALGRICGASQKGLPLIEFPKKYEKFIRGIAMLQEENTTLNRRIKENEAKIDAHSVRIAELMKTHEHGVLITTTDKLLVDFVTRTTRRVDSGYLKKEHPSIYEASLKTSESRKVKVSIQPA